MQKQTFLFILILCLLSLSCRTLEKAPERFAGESFSGEGEGYGFELRLLSRKDLTARHGGGEGNPFLSYPSVISPREIVVFELSLYARGEELRLNNDDLLLTVGDQAFTPQTARRFHSLWEVHDDRSRQSVRRTKLIDRQMKGEELIVPANESLSCYLVFAERFPDFLSGREDASIGLCVADGKGRKNYWSFILSPAQ